MTSPAWLIASSLQVAQTAYQAYLKAREGVLGRYLEVICPLINAQLEKRAWQGL